MHRTSTNLLRVGAALGLLAMVAQPLPVSAIQVVHKLSGVMPTFGDIDIGEARRPTISPDGQYAIYVADQTTDEAGELWSVPIDGQSSPVRLSGLLPSGTRIERFTIAPDSGHVVYIAAQDSCRCHPSCTSCR